MASRKHKIGCCVANAYPKERGGWGPRREIYRNSETIFVTSNPARLGSARLGWRGDSIMGLIRIG